MKSTRAIFLDRDGIINDLVFRDNGFFSPRVFSDFKLKRGIKKFSQKTKSLGFLTIVVTNQPDIERKLMKVSELEKMHSVIMENLSVDEIVTCPHDDKNNCLCRKPKPGMIKDMSKKWHIDLKKSFIIGDSWKDVEAGKQAGCKTIFLKTDYNKKEEIFPDFKVSSFREIIDIIK
ncbi:MAG: HAD-IIIA family hydrolase [Candidatus Paceibacterota bacterium]|jgi:D-glycero-D-manno-heptose 1,7-bisphosphate phosphatase